MRRGGQIEFFIKNDIIGLFLEWHNHVMNKNEPEGFFYLKTDQTMTTFLEIMTKFLLIANQSGELLLFIRRRNTNAGQSIRAREL
jgi:hypothetical protein